MSEGYIHSIESMGLVDGPGIRSVVFLQGCRLRCCYCHNPDTWPVGEGKIMAPGQLVEKIARFKTYFDAGGGGVTFSGGEPLLQPEFLAECLKLFREEGIHTCIDTAGEGFGEYEEILRYTDLVLYDVKHYIPESYREITGRSMEGTQKFLEEVQQREIPLWIRHVVVPGLTDSTEHIKGLAEYVKGIRNVQRVELLGYHVLGREKYRASGVPYRLESVPAMDKEELQKWQGFLDGLLRQT